jgi:hypothetical protein
MVLPVSWNGPLGQGCETSGSDVMAFTYTSPGPPAEAAMFKAKKEGTADVRCQDQTVKVEVRKIARLELQRPKVIKVGEEFQMQLAAYDDHDNRFDDKALDGLAIDWQSSGPFRVGDSCPPRQGDMPIIPVPCAPSKLRNVTATEAAKGTLTVSVVLEDKQVVARAAVDLEATR